MTPPSRAAAVTFLRRLARGRLVCLVAVVLASRCPAQETLQPLVRVVDLSVGEHHTVELCNGQRASVRLVELNEHRDSLSQAVRRAEVRVEVNGTPVTLVAATYHLPRQVGSVQIDCSVTGGYNSNGTKSSWGLEKDARLRLWPADSPWVRPETFRYPVEQRWFATHTQMANVPTYVDGGDKPSRKRIYYHSGLDIGGTEGFVPVRAATDGVVVSAGGEVLLSETGDTPVSPRYDVVYLRDQRGWYYRYSHLKEIDERIKVGRTIAIGTPIGVLGKEGASGGWSHLHFEIKARQPSGQWGTQAGYAFLWQAYLQHYRPRVIAVARPHHFLRCGESTVLDASRSWSRDGEPLQFAWQFHDGTTSSEPTVKRTYDRAGSYSEIVRVTDGHGAVSWDFAIVQVVDGEKPTELPPTIHPTYYPTFGIRPGDPVRFTVRSFRTSTGQETWDFGDGSPPVKVTSDGNAEPRAAAGYAVTTHTYEKPGDYVVRVERSNEHGLNATAHLHVRVEAEASRDR